MLAGRHVKSEERKIIYTYVYYFASTIFVDCSGLVTKTFPQYICLNLTVRRIAKLVHCQVVLK